MKTTSKTKKNQSYMKTKQTTLLTTTTLALCAAAFMFTTNGMAAPKDTLNAADVKFVKHAAASGTAEVKIADLGVKKAERADVKAFAEMISSDHTKVNAELKELAKTKGVEISAVIAPDHAGTFQKLEKSSGAEFDKEFLSTMVSSHKKGVSNYEAASKDAKDKEVKAFADKTLSALKTHLAKAEELSAVKVTSK
jgi:putative membrane protein